MKKVVAATLFFAAGGMEPKIDNSEAVRERERESARERKRDREREREVFPFSHTHLQKMAGTWGYNMKMWSGANAAI